MNYLSIRNLIIVLLLAFGLSSCELAGDILEAGIWTAVIGIVLLIAIVAWILKKIF
jgi:hypothetical protein